MATLDLRELLESFSYNRKLFCAAISSIMVLIYDFIYLIIESFVS